MATKFLRHSDEITYAMSDELYHYGVKGMKWGKHKSARDYVTSLGRIRRVRKQLGRYAPDGDKVAVRAFDKTATNAHNTAVRQARAERRGREAALAEQERQRKANSREERVRKQLGRYAPDGDKVAARAFDETATNAHNTAVRQARAERRGREAALAEQERQRRARNKKYLPGKSKKV